MTGADSLVGVDLPLLTALKELLGSESVTVAARRLGTTQPNMSRTLARLRVLFQDPLLVPVGRGLQRTPRAQQLQPQLERALDGMRALLSAPAPLVPSEERRVVRIAASDYATAVLLHPWVARLRKEAPGVTVQIEPVGAGTIDPLARGELDLAIAPRIPVVGLDQFVFREILNDRLVCVLRKGHPRTPKVLTMRSYLALEHVMVGALLPPVSTVQEALHRCGKVRNVVARVPTMLSALQMVADTDLAAAIPERLLGTMDARARAGVVWFPLPFRVESIALSLVWHPRCTTDPRHRWLRDTVFAAAPAALAGD